MILLTPDLQLFFNELNQWIDDGCPDHKLFKRNNLLCHTWHLWKKSFFIGPDHRDDAVFSALLKEESRIKYTFPNTEEIAYPFGGHKAAMDDIKHGSVWLMNDRLCFVRSMDTRPRHLRNKKRSNRGLFERIKDGWNAARN